MGKHNSAAYSVTVRDSERRIAGAIAKNPNRWSESTIQAALRIEKDEISDEQAVDVLDAFEVVTRRVLG